ncbi:MAG: transketolase [Magnetococcales bacterium]|nr:transketolase [Magnetococcales bacterium]
MTQNSTPKQSSNSSLDKLAVTTLRMLAIDAVEKANSGHPGLPLGAAPMAYTLWAKVMRHNPSNPGWMDRDRFILSAGHGSAMLYGLLHLTGYDVSLDDIKQFRQFGSNTPGHPEYGHTPGVEATTGPLGQGFAMGVGMAMAERHLAQNFNRQEYLPIVDHFTYAIVSDGDLMEGIAAEAASLAGHLCLGKLIYLYDDNKITIEGNTDLTFSEGVAERFESYQWQVLHVEDGEDMDAIEAAIRQGQLEEERPTLIVVRTHIGHGSPKVDSSGVHGSPIKGEVMDETRKFYEWPQERFHLPQEAVDHCRLVVARGQEQQEEWEAHLQAFSTQYPQDGVDFIAQMDGQLPQDWSMDLDNLAFADDPVATRVASGKSLNALADKIPMLIGGSADLAPSNNTWMHDKGDRNIHFGIREHAMAAVCNGMALHAGVIPFCGTFLVFSDYMRGAMRLSALMGTHVTYVLTHDSVAVGEDGPTHQPVEHMATMRALPGLITMRPADAQETAAAWSLAISLKKPMALVLSRQNLQVLDPGVRASVSKGAYVLADCVGDPDILLLASGSEVQLVMEAHAILSKDGKKVRVVSMPSWELFEEQPRSYRDSVLPPAITARLGVEAGSSLGWHRWVGDRGSLITIDRFGMSAPGGKAMEELGFNVENVVAKAKLLLAG